MLKRFTYLLLIAIFGLFIFSQCKGSKKSGGKSKNKAESKVEKVIKTAKSYTGTPYRFGGTTRSGIDCSGLMLNCFKEINITLPRTSREQAKIGKEVPLSKVQPGDLVFMSASKRSKKVTHVGLISRVDKEKVYFIHASTKAGVVESDLFAPYYKPLIVSCRRVIPQ